MNKVENLDGVRPILNKLKENRKGLYISRIPDNTKQEFIEFAERDFCGDYGMCLKWCLSSIVSQDTQLIIEQLADHETRLTSIESNQGNIMADSKSDNKEIKTCSGKTIDKNE